MKRPPLRVFYSYAHENDQAPDHLDQHLELLVRRNLILRWHDQHIVPGREWDIIVAGGGPFDFGAHEFTEAELSPLSKGARTRSLRGFKRLRQALNRQIPPRRYERNILMANWTLRRFGSLQGKHFLPEALYFMAQVISAFDLAALQEVYRNLDQLKKLLEILGPDWSYLSTDIAPGSVGNNERFVFLYYIMQ